MQGKKIQSMDILTGDFTMNDFLMLMASPMTVIFVYKAANL